MDTNSYTGIWIFVTNLLTSVYLQRDEVLKLISRDDVFLSSQLIQQRHIRKTYLGMHKCPCGFVDIQHWAVLRSTHSRQPLHSCLFLLVKLQHMLISSHGAP